MTKRSIETDVVHAGERKPLPVGLPNATPIFANSTFGYSSMEEADKVFSGDLKDFIYTRYGNPTVEAFQDAVRVLENGAVARAYSSGMAALHAALLASDLAPGSFILASRDLYGASFDLIYNIFGPFGVKTQLVDFSDLGDLKRKTEDLKPRVLLAETISNPVLKVLDVAAVAEIAHSVGAKFIVDSTFATPYLVRPLDLGADLVVHSATKYLGGNADATGGVVVARDIADEPALTSAMKLAGGILSVWEAHSISKGLKTLALRLEKQCSNAEQLAERLSKHGSVQKVYYPKFTTDGVAEKVIRRPYYGALVSIVLADDTRDAAWKFMNSLNLCVRATSLGDVFTSVSHSASSSHRELTEKRRNSLGITEGLVRISVGIENIDDIFADIDQALAKAKGKVKRLNKAMLRFTQQHLDAMKAHAEADYPHECGGLLLGHLAADNSKTVVETLPMANTADVETRHDRVLIDPRDLMKADRYARSKGVDVIGYYHSHPDDEAVPSQFDLDHALPVWSYIIFSVRNQKAVDWNSWEMENDRSKFNKELTDIL